MEGGLKGTTQKWSYSRNNRKRPQERKGHVDSLMSERHSSANAAGGVIIPIKPYPIIFQVGRKRKNEHLNPVDKLSNILIGYSNGEILMYDTLADKPDKVFVCLFLFINSLFYFVNVECKIYGVNIVFVIYYFYFELFY